MLGPAEVVLIILVAAIALAIVLGPPILSLVAMRRTGKGWARTRLIAYFSTAVLYAILALVFFARGNGLVVAASAIIMFFAGKGAVEGFRAWRRSDYRPAHLRISIPEA